MELTSSRRPGHTHETGHCFSEVMHTHCLYKERNILLSVLITSTIIGLDKEIIQAKKL